MDEQSARPRTLPRWWRIALPASILLNLFLVAVVSGYVLHGRAASGPLESPLRRALLNAQSKLSPADSKVFTAVITRDYPHFEAADKALNEARQEVWRQLGAPVYDPSLAKQALINWRNAVGQFMDDFSDTLVEAAGQISMEGRQKLFTNRRGERGDPPQP
jgi:uncharacterized membrane protein